MQRYMPLSIFILKIHVPTVDNIVRAKKMWYGEEASVTQKNTGQPLRS